MIAMLERDGFERTNGERSENGTQFADHSLSTNEWADLEAVTSREPRRLSYFEHQLQPNPDYSGILECMSVEEARALFEQMPDRFDICGFQGLLLPPRGLPGFRRDGYTETTAAAKLIEIGVKYALAVIRSEPRAMHLRWQDAEDFIRVTKREAEDAVYTEQARIAIQEWDKREATPQFVYFIGAESGPIKIGIATKPQNRLRELQTSHHEKLCILATRDGSMETEKAYHKQFAAHRLKGEWFERCPEIEAEIERLNNAV